MGLATRPLELVEIFAVYRVNLDSPMPVYLSYVLSILLCISPFLAMASDVQAQASSPIVVIEATSTVHANNAYRDQLLLVRLTDDGKVEWDKPVLPRGWERQTGSVSLEQVSEIKRRLHAIHGSSLHGSMGPYGIYEDWSDELQIKMTTKKGEATFSVINPWASSDHSRRHKRMPRDVRVVVCEIDRLHAQVADVPVKEVCKPTSP
jgi:hypothetical protein